MNYINAKELVGTDNTDHNACSVYALGATFNMSFKDAQDAANKLFFREKGKGARMSMIVDALTMRYSNGKLLNGCKITEIYENVINCKKRMNRVKLSYFAKHSTGRWYCLVNGHAIAIVDGKIVDNMHEGFSDSKFVMWACKVEGEAE